MRTLSEILNEIKDMSVKLDELHDELENLKPKDNINNQIDFAEIRRLAKQYPIENHRLKDADSYKKKLYLSLLSAIAQTNNDNRENKLVLLGRIASGIGSEEDIESIVKDGMEITDETIDEFINCMEDKESSQFFIFESLIISGLGGEVDDIAKKYISKLSNYLRITKDEAFFLIKLSAAVIEQSSSKYKELINIVPETVNIFMLYNSYLKNFINEVICDTCSLFYINNCDIYENSEIIKKISDKNLEATQVIFENVRFHLKKFDKVIIIKNCSSVTFKNCNFSSGKSYLQFETVDYINLINCKFIDFKKGVCVCNDKCKEIMIKGCTFEKCEYLKDDSHSDRNCGGCFCIEKINSFILRNSKFIDCNIINDEGRDPSGIIAYFNNIDIFKCENTIFTNCRGYLYYYYSFKSTLFYGLYNISGKDECFKKCQTINSAKLY